MDIDTKIKTNHVTIKGIAAQHLGTASFPAVMHHLLSPDSDTPWTDTDHPQHYRRRVLEYLMSACVDHGLSAPSAHCAHRAGSCGVPVENAIASGLVTIGERHAPVAKCARWLCDEKWAELARPEDPFALVPFRASVRAKLRQRRRFPGFGHPYHRKDPRVEHAMHMMQRCPPASAFSRLIVAREEIERTKGVPLNIAGVFAAVALDLGIPPYLTPVPFLLSRSIGMAVHAYEAQEGKMLVL